MIKLSEIKKRYEQGENISAWLRQEMNVAHNTPEIIEISYDVQAGSYINLLNNVEIANHKKEMTSEIAQTILSLCTPQSILEAGVGEATTLTGVVKNLGNDISNYGVDISWSRVAYAKDFLKKQGVKKSTLCTGDLFNLPFLDNSIDVVYTGHSIEPNGGNEEAIIRELYRVARKYVILLEPGYEFANQEQQQRMDSLGYCKNLNNISCSLDYDVIKHELFPYCSNPSNPTAITIIAKNCNKELPLEILACPKFKVPLRSLHGSLYSPNSLLVYPIIGEIACLRIENGVIASKFEDVFEIK